MFKKIISFFLSIGMLVACVSCNGQSQPKKFGEIKNVILLIGDGMGPNQIRAGELYKEEKLFMQTIDQSIKVETNSKDGVTDSAAAATALSTGTRTHNGRVGIDGEGNELRTLVDIAHDLGKRTGVITTEELYGATPMGFSGHSLSRNNMSVDSDGTAGREDFSGTACATARLGIKGMQFGMIEYEALFDFSEGDVTAKNVYAGFRNLPSGIGMRVGHFKEPWSLENLTSSRHGLTMERSLLNRTKDLCGGRNYGIMFHNWDAEQRLTWAAGLFAASMPESLDAVLGDEDHLAFTGRLTAQRSPCENTIRKTPPNTKHA